MGAGALRCAGICWSPSVRMSPAYIAHRRRSPKRSDPSLHQRDDERINRAIRLVDGIREKALSLGWSLERLYRHEGFHKRPFAGEYGLVCYIAAAARLGEVARQWIEIIGPPPSEVRTRFYNRTSISRGLSGWTRRKSDAGVYKSAAFCVYLR